MTYKRDELVLKPFGERLRQLRKQKGISQKQLANEIETEVSRISKLERGIGNPSLTTLYNIACALDVPLVNLFSFDIKKTSRTK